MLVTPTNDYSIVSRVAELDGSLHFHSFHSKQFIWISPSTKVPLQTSRYGNVAYSIGFSFVVCSNVTEFYYVEFLHYRWERSLRIFLTNRECTLWELDLWSPLLFDRLSERWKSAKIYNSENLTIEIIVDINIPFHIVNYVKASRQHVRDLMPLAFSSVHRWKIGLAFLFDVEKKKKKKKKNTSLWSIWSSYKEWSLLRPTD